MSNRITLTRAFDAPRAAVFALFADLASAPQNISAIQELELLTDGPVGVGTRWREARILFGHEAVEEMEITLYEPDERYRVEAESCGAHYLTEFRFEDTGSRTTRVTVTFDSTPRSVLAYLMLPLCWLLKGSLRRALAQDMDDLADVLRTASTVA
jgi:uncharacterized membrane protein